MWKDLRLILKTGWRGAADLLASAGQTRYVMLREAGVTS